MTHKHIRFWTCWNGSYVKLTLTQDAPISLYHAWKHDEGWSSEGETLWVEDGVLYSAMATDGTDCDGRTSTHSTYRCALADIASETPHNRYDPEIEPIGWAWRQREIAGVRLPKWRRIDAGQRDYSAEAAGY